MAFNGTTFLTIVTPLFVLGLALTSAYAWWNSSYLHLPISRVVAFLTTFIPFLALAAVQFLRTGASQQGRSKPHNRQITAPTKLSDKSIFLTFFLLLLDTSLLTLNSTSLPDKPLLCPLNNSWEKLWSSPEQRHSAHPAIETIQNSLDCCGLHSDHDKYFPFPPHFNNTNPPCTQFYPKRVGKTCYEPWVQQTQKSAGLLLATAIGSALVKILGLLFVRYNSNPVVQGMLYKPWFKESSQQQEAQQNESENSEGRIHSVESDEGEEYIYDSDARIRRNGHGNRSGSSNGARYLGTGSGENERLLGNTDGGEDRRNDYYSNSEGFGAIQPSLLR